MKRSPITIIVLLFGSVLGLAAALRSVSPGLRTPQGVNRPSIAASAPSPKGDLQAPSGWHRIDVQGKATLYIPSDMRSGKPFGDSAAHREVYGNAKVGLTISYEASELCALPEYLKRRSTYSESLIEINGKKAKLAIDTYYEPKFTMAYLCFPELVSTDELAISAICRGKEGLTQARQIFETVKFK